MDHNTYNFNFTEHVNDIGDVDRNDVTEYNPESDNIADKQGNDFVMGHEEDGVCSTYTSFLTGESQIFIDKGKAPVVNDFNSNEQTIDVEDGNFLTDDRFDYCEDDTVPESVNDYYSSKVSHSPNGNTYWKPVLPVNEIPVKGTMYSSLYVALKMYKVYASKAGFSTRLSTIRRAEGDNSTIKYRYILCNKSGSSKLAVVDTLDDKHTGSSSRKRKVKVTNCKARATFKYVENTPNYYLFDFVEEHNHPLIQHGNRDFSKVSRRLQYPEKRYILRLSTSNIGPSNAYRIRSLTSGGQRKGHGNVADFMNFRRDMNQYIGDWDAQMFINRMEKRSKLMKEDTFVYHTESNEIVLAFWADEVAKINYSAFGDVIAFDATFRSNKSFLDAHGKQPKLVLTDQDPAMKVVVNNVLDEAHHRLCMKHIMDKLPVKIAGDILANTDLRKRLNKLVWNIYLTPTEFEEHQRAMDSRERWIPGYFRELPMCCLMKTTSRAESTNAFFRRYMNPDNTLLQFIVCFEMAMDDQRYMQRKFDFETMTSTPKYMTRLPIEVFAAKIYTHEVFLNVSQEIFKGDLSCAIKGIETGDGTDVYVVRHNEKVKQYVNDYKVVYRKDRNEVECSCINFARIGFLCRHIFCVFKFLGVNAIPHQYIQNRWTRDPIPEVSLKLQTRYRMFTDHREELFCKSLEIVESCASRLRGDVKKFELFVDKLKSIQDEIDAETPVEPPENNNSEVFKDFFDVSSPEDITSSAPHDTRNKGWGSKKRKIGAGEKAVEKIKKNFRNYNMCGGYVDHDTRNCALNPKNIQKEKEKQRQEMEKKKQELVKQLQ
ncbi:hypothetical protein QVD17_30704 [Tagetes erecta]|uniref:SWIM-type domain-containing protein n=1 Tax=Tagetes erecta TaxID=13708 RepID=A0AAD8K443_TARER|nr:hypothetical protein QVD17_30704 [Tagetes erecta]